MKYYWNNNWNSISNICNDESGMCFENVIRCSQNMTKPLSCVIFCRIYLVLKSGFGLKQRVIMTMMRMGMKKMTRKDPRKMKNLRSVITMFYLFSGTFCAVFINPTVSSRWSNNRLFVVHYDSIFFKAFNKAKALSIIWTF